MEGQAYVDGGVPQPIEDITTLFRRAAQEHPEVEAVVSLHQKPIINLPGIQQDVGDPHLIWTFKHLKDASESLALRLSSLGLSRGTSIVMVSENCAEWALFIWAAIRLSCPFVPVNPAVIANADELRHILQVVCPGVVIVQDEKVSRTFEENVPIQMSSAFLKITLSPLQRPYILEEMFPENYLPLSQRSCLISAEEQALKPKTIGWIHLLSLWPSHPEEIPFPKRTTKATFENTITIGFTSGTTSFPKACPQSPENFKLVCALSRGSRQRICQHGPPYHGIACFMALANWANGSTVVYPSAKFDVKASLDAVESERCTTMIAVPAMIKAFAMVPDISQRRLGSLNSVGLAGAPVFPETIHLCREVLRIKTISVNWGMSENPAPIVFVVTEETEINREDYFPVGKPVPGMKVKICAPGSRVPLNRGLEGELHAGGPQVIGGYINASNDSFYEDGDGRWIITGDMASMDSDGNVFILGRYKDIVIRGGVNIAPANVEQKLNSIPGVDSQVIGVPDEMAGEVPVAIIKLQGPAAEDSRATISKLQQLALRELGPKIAPTKYVNLQQDLDLDIYPTSTSGKIKKAFLRGKVLEFFAQSDLRAENGVHSQPTENVLAELWSQVSGLSSEKIDRTTSVLTFVDSITTMRFSGTVRKQLDKDISVSDIAQHPTIRQQAQLLDSRGKIVTNAPTKRAGPPTAHDMAHCNNGDEALAARTRNLATEMLTKLGLSWTEDVEDVLAAPDTLAAYLRRSRPQTWNQRAIFIARNTSHDELVLAWKATLSHHPVLRSLAIKYDEPETQLLLVVRDQDPWWNCSTFPNIAVPNYEGLRDVLKEEWADPETGPLIRAGFARIENNPQDSALIFIGNHGVFDNVSAGLFFEDLATSVKNKLFPESIVRAPGHVSFKEYADAYHLHRTGRAALDAVTFHATRLKGVGAHTTALWPQKRAPGWFKGTDSGWKDVDGNMGDPRLRKPLDTEVSERFGLDGLTRTAKIPGLPALREKHGVLPHIVIKAAVTLFNIHRTGSPTALFANLEAARNWPFTADWVPDNQQLPNPLSIAGPTFELLVNCIEVVDKEEPVLSFLQRIHKDQTELSANSHVPLRELLSSSSLNSEDVAVIREVLNRQIWNWPAGIQTQAQQATSSTSPSSDGNTEPQAPSFEKFTRAAYDDVGLAWTCGLWDKETLYLNGSYDDCQLSKDEVFVALGEVLSVAAWLVQNADTAKVGEAIFEMGDEVVGGLIDSLE